MCCAVSKMQERPVLLVLLAYSSCFRLAIASSIACETSGVGAFCEPLNGRGCDGIDRITHSQESDRCWPSGRFVYNMDIGSFGDTKTVGRCPNRYLNDGGCVDAVEAGASEPSAHRQVQNLDIKYKPVNLFMYNITVSWTYEENNPSPDGVKAYKLQLTGGPVPDVSDENFCVCINSTLNLTEYTFTVDYSNGPSDPLTASVFTLPYVTRIREDAFEVETSREVPATCADIYETELPYDISACGLPLYGRPRNINMEQRETSTVLSWEKPCFRKSQACDLWGHGLTYISPEIYYLTLTDNHQVKHYLKVSNATKVILNTSSSPHVKVFAYVPCSGLYEYGNTNTGPGNGCSVPGEVGDEDKPDEATCCSFLSSSAVPMSTFMFTPTPTPSPPPSTLSSPTYIYATSAIAIIVLILILTAALCGIIWIIWRYRRPGRGYSLKFSRDSSPPEPIDPGPIVSVLVIFSPRTPQLETQTIMQCLVAELGNYNIESQIPDLHLPRENIFDWLTEQHEKVDAVLFVCNKYFSEEWKQTVILENHLKVVYCIKTLFRIDSDKYAVVLTDSDDHEHIPPLLENRKTYSIDDYDGIARFVRNIPRFARSIPAAAIP